jgi:ribosomal-protein-alanine N-acetyltransferase
MLIETNRLLLILLDDNTLQKYKQDLIDLNADKDVRFYYPTGIATKDQTLERMKEFVEFYKKHNTPSFVILSKLGTEFYGRCGFSILPNGETEVGYLLHKKFWGQGYATEVLEALLIWATKNLKAPYIIGYAPVEHKASQKVMQKCGMMHYKTEKDQMYGTICTFYKYMLARSQP